MVNLCRGHEVLHGRTAEVVEEHGYIRNCFIGYSNEIISIVYFLRGLILNF